MLTHPASLLQLVTVECRSNTCSPSWVYFPMVAYREESSSVWLFWVKPVQERSQVLVPCFKTDIYLNVRRMNHQIKCFELWVTFNERSRREALRISRSNFLSVLFIGEVGHQLIVFAPYLSIQRLAHTHTLKSLMLPRCLPISQSRGCVPRLLLPLTNRVNPLQIWCRCALQSPHWESLMLQTNACWFMICVVCVHVKIRHSECLLVTYQ